MCADLEERVFVFEDFTWIGQARRTMSNRATMGNLVAHRSPSSPCGHCEEGPVEPLCARQEISTGGLGIDARAQ